jgi:hypothetical protein
MVHLLPAIWQLPMVCLFIGLLMQLRLVSFWVFFGLWVQGNCIMIPLNLRRWAA